MLVANSNVGEVVAVKLVNDTEIIGRLESIEGSTYTFKRPVIIHMMKMQNNETGLTFVPFTLSVDESQTFEIDYSQMLFKPVQPRADITKEYVRITTGIELVTPGNFKL